MDIPSGQELFAARMGLDEQNEGFFWQTVNPKEDEELFAVFDSAIRSLYVLKQAALLQRPHVDYELTFALERIVSHAFAVVALLEKGFVAEAYSPLRMIGEGCNLLLLLASDDNEMQVFLTSNENQRDAKFGASQVRNKLDALDQAKLVDSPAYRNLSRRFAHFSTGSVFLNSSAYGTEVMGLEFHQANIRRSIHIWAVFILAALRLGLQVVKYPTGDATIGELDAEAAAALELVQASLYPE